MLSDAALANALRFAAIIVSALALVVAFLAESRARRADRRSREAERKAADVEAATRRPSLFATDIFLNPYHVGTHEDVTATVKKEKQRAALVHRYRRKGGDREVSGWSLLTRQAGDSLRLKGQVNLVNGGFTEARLLDSDQKFWWKQKPISSPPVAQQIAFTCYPRQEFNVNFEVTIPDAPIDEGDLLYRLLLRYSDVGGAVYEYRVFWWYDATDDKWWNNMNKVPGFEGIRSLDSEPALPVPLIKAV